MPSTALTAVSLVLVATGAGSLALAYWVLRTGEGTAIRPFVVLLTVVGAMAVGDGIAGAAASPQGLMLVWALAYVLIPVAFARFVVEYYGLSYLATRLQRGAFYGPAAVGIAGSVALVAVSPSAPASVMSGGEVPAGATLPAAVYHVAGVANQVGIYYAGGVMLASAGLLVQTCRRYVYLDTEFGAALSFVGLWPWVAYLTTPVTFGAFSTPAILAVTAAGYLLSLLAAGYVVFTGRLFEATPAAGTLGPETVLAELADPVVVVDHADRVVRINDRAAETFDASAAEAAGEPFESVVGVAFDAFVERDCVELTVDGRTRHFEGTVAEVRDRHGRTPGRAIVVRDITRRRTRSQRLSVLNRVLRHNLRNEMTNIIGRAELLAAGRRSGEDVADAILATADELVSLGERAREVEEMMAVTPRPGAETDLREIVDGVVDAVAENYPEVRFDVDVEAGLAVPVDDRILEPVVRNLVENAARHNDADDPAVEVGATVDPDRSGVVRLTVADNGPGIPESERAVIQDGQESPLEHGSGLGLWAVYWGVTRMGGDFAFEDRDPRGTRVVVRIPRATGESASDRQPATALEAD